MSSYELYYQIWRSSDNPVEREAAFQAMLKLLKPSEDTASLKRSI